MKLYRYFLGCLLVFFIIIAVLYVFSFYDERRSTENGTLIWRQNIDYVQGMRGVEGDVTGYSIC